MHRLVLAACWLGLASAAHGQQTDEVRMNAAFARGEELIKLGKYDEAIAQHQIAVGLAARVYGDRSVSMAAYLNQLAVAHLFAGQYAKAEPLFQRCLKLNEANRGAEHPEVATSLNNLARVYDMMGQHAKAEPLYLRSLRISEAKLGRDHLDVATSLNNLATLYQNLSQYAKAEPLFQRSFEIRESKLGRDHLDVGQSLNNLALLYQDMGQHAKAGPLYLRSLKIHEAQLGQDHPEVATILNNLALLFQALGQYGKAEPLYQRSLRIREAKLGKGHPDVAASLAALATLYQDMGQYAKAESFYLRGLQIEEASLGQDHPGVAASVNNLAELYRVMGQYAKAEPLYQRSLRIWEAKLGSDHLHVAYGLNNLALLYTAMGQHAKAEPFYQRSLKIKESKLGQDHPDVAISLLSLAVMYYRDMSQHAKAEPLIQRSLQIFEAKLGKEHPHVAAGLNHLANLYQAMGQYAKAEPLYQRSLRIRETKLGQDHPEVAGSWHDLAELYAAQERWPEAATLFDRSRRIHVSFFRNTLPILSPREQLSFLDLYVRAQAAPLSLAYRRRQDNMIVERSAGWLLNGKGLTQDALAQSLLRKPSQEAKAHPWIELDQVRQVMPADTVLIEVARFGLYDFMDTRKRILPGHYAVWLIPPAGKGNVEIVDLGPAEPIEQAVAAFRKSIEEAPGVTRTEGEPDAEKKAQASLQALSKLVLAPMQEKIGPAKQWLVSPDAALWLVPWAALPLADGSYAVEKHTIRYLISGRELVQTAATGKPGRARIIADPDFDLAPATARAELKQLAGNIAPASDFRAAVMLALPRAPRLPGTKAEADAIKPKLDQYIGQETWVYQDRQALEGIIKRVRKPGVLVLSTHGFFLEDQEVAGGDLLASRGSGPVLTKDGKPLENPLLRCGLLLAGCNRRDQATQADDEDGVLTGAEIVSLDLQGTALVVLSACETGVGQVNVGEGVAGLRQAFQIAGAQSVVATLWHIPDRESAQLMAKFIENLAKGQPRAEALRNAQLWMIQARRDRNGAAHPFFWAAYTLTGKGQ